jgi:hypothetical protein
MRATRRMYAIVLGTASVVLVGSMVGAVAYAANGGPSGGNDNSWSQGLSGGGMMGGYQADSSGAASVTVDQAKAIAADWATANLPGATVDAGRQMPMGYLFVATKDGKIVAHLMVNDDTGKVYAVNTTGVGGGGMMGQGWANGRGQMMGQGGRPGAVAMTPSEAQTRADAWLAANQPGATATTGTLRPMGYAFTVSKAGSVIGRLMVVDRGGQVVFHAYASTTSGGSA